MNDPWNLNIYSLPRSGTNLFAGYLAMFENVLAYNVDGGRRPFAPELLKSESELFSYPGILTNITCSNIIVRDELSANLVGPKKYWMEQIIFRVYEKFTMNQRVVLLRNPYSIASSMHRYQLKHTSHAHVWNMMDSRQMAHFVNRFRKLLLFVKKRRSRCLIVSPFEFFENPQYQKSILQKIGLDSAVKRACLKCINNHKYELLDDQFSCECGILMGQGGYNPAKSIDPNRLLTETKFMETDIISQLEEMLRNQIGEKLTDVFNENGRYSIQRLQEEL